LDEAGSIILEKISLYTFDDIPSCLVGIKNKRRSSKLLCRVATITNPGSEANGSALKEFSAPAGKFLFVW
jgi:hypothetical protein